MLVKSVACERWLPLLPVSGRRTSEWRAQEQRSVHKVLTSLRIYTVPLSIL